MIDVAFQRRRRVGAAANLPAGIRQLRVGRRDHSIGGAVAAVGQSQPIGPANETAGHQQAGRAQRLVAHDHAGAESQSAGELVRFVLQGGGNLDGGVADGQTSAGLEIEPRQQRCIDRGAERAVARRQRAGERHGGIERHGAVQRIDAVHGFEFDQRLASVAGARHRAQQSRDRNLSARIKELAFLRAGLAVDQRKGQIAAQDDAAVASKSIGEASRERADARDRRHAQRDAGDEDTKAVQAAAQLAKRKAQRTKFGRGRGERHAGFGAYRLRRMCTGQNSSTGIPMIIPASQTYGETQVCATLSLGPHT